MARAHWNGTTLAESDETVVVEGNHYFPADSLVAEHFEPSSKTTLCGWKGSANYYNVRVGDAVNPDAAWYYATPKPEAQRIAGHVAFWRGIEVDT